MKALKVIACVLLSLLFCQCKSNRNLTEAERMLKQWIGKTVVFPDGLMPVVKNADDTLKITASTDYAILFYSDSSGCTSCKLKLSNWKQYIQEMDDLHTSVKFLFYLSPKDGQDLVEIFTKGEFGYPVFIDKTDKINELNHFPDNVQYQCFLLDSRNRILAAGNPVFNSRIWDVYKSIITGNKEIEKIITTAAVPEPTDLQLENLQVGKTCEGTFKLKNTGVNPLIIREVDASCGCTVPEWDKQPVAAGQTTEIKVRVTPEDSGYFDKTVTVRCNVESGIILLRVSGTVEQ
jgi:hypothetical protein